MTHRATSIYGTRSYLKRQLIPDLHYQLTLTN